MVREPKPSEPTHYRGAEVREQAEDKDAWFTVVDASGTSAYWFPPESKRVTAPGMQWERLEALQRQAFDHRQTAALIERLQAVVTALEASHEELETTVQAQHLTLEVIRESSKRQGPPLDPVLEHLRSLRAVLADEGHSREEIGRIIRKSLRAVGKSRATASRSKRNMLANSKG
jgi:hypothetical protein